MGRREDGAAVRDGPEIWPRPRRDGATGKSRRRSMRRRGPEGDVPSCTRAMAGLRSQALGPAARSWLTGVAMSTSSEARPAYRKNAASGAPGGAFLLTKGGRGRLRKASHRMVSPAIHRGLAHPRVSRRSAPLEGSEDLEFARGPARGRPKNAGDFLWLVCKRIEERAARAHSPFVPAKAGIQR
jgi:hypothetical protein